MKNNKKQAAIIAAIGLAVFVIAFAGIMLTRNVGKSAKTVSTESAVASIEKYIKKIAPKEAEQVKSPVELAGNDVDELPDIDTNEITVKPSTSLYAEIFSTSEKCGPGKDGWINQVARSFNEAGFEVDKEPVSVMIRNVASGLGMDYIRAGKYIPAMRRPMISGAGCLWRTGWLWRWWRRLWWRTQRGSFFQRTPRKSWWKSTEPLI